jgi:hypothetical protein
VLVCRGAHLVRFIDSERLINMTDSFVKTHGITDISEFDKFIKIIKTVLTDSAYKFRLERNTISIFFQDVSFYNGIYESVSVWLKEFHSPASAEELHLLTTNTAKKIICNKLPHDRYQFKVTIKSSMDPNLRQSFKIWADKYGEKFKFANHTLEWIRTGSKGYGWNPMVHVSDPAVLSLVVLFLSGNIGKVHEFVPRSSINTSLDQEQSCQHLVKI